MRSFRIGLADYLGVYSDQVDGSPLPWIVQHAAYQINRCLVRSDGKTSYEKVFNKSQKSPIVHFGKRVLAHTQSQPPAQGLQIRGTPQTSSALWIGKDVIMGMHIVSLSDGQALKTRAITRLVREEQFNVTEFKKFKVAARALSVDNQENSYDKILFRNCSIVSASTEEQCQA